MSLEILRLNSRVSRFSFCLLVCLFLWNLCRNSEGTLELCVFQRSTSTKKEKIRRVLIIKRNVPSKCVCRFSHSLCFISIITTETSIWRRPVSQSLLTLDLMTWTQLVSDLILMGKSICSACREEEECGCFFILCRTITVFIRIIHISDESSSQRCKTLIDFVALPGRHAPKWLFEFYFHLSITSKNL